MYQVQFHFSPEWEGLSKTACFRSGPEIISVLLDSGGRCTVPWEVTDPGDSGKRLLIGVYGSRGGSVILPTVWADCGVIREGACCGTGSRPPAPGQYEQLLDAVAGRADGMAYDGEMLSLTAGSRVLSSVKIRGEPEDGTDHRSLTYREAEEQHPITAITGLERELSRRVNTDDALSVVEIIKIMEE